MIRRKNRNKIGGEDSGGDDVNLAVSRPIPIIPILILLTPLPVPVPNSPANRCTRF